MICRGFTPTPNVRANAQSGTIPIPEVPKHRRRKRNMDEKNLQSLLTMGFSIIPIKKRDKIAAVKWREFTEKHPTIDQINAWKTQGYANFAVVTGRISDVIVVDIDSKEAFEQVATLGIPEGVPIVSTGKGYHLYFKYPEYIASEIGKVKTGVNIGGISGLDLRADGGYVLAPGSIHPSGRVYKWHVAPDDSNFQTFPNIPDWLGTILRTSAVADSGRTRGGSAPSGKVDLGSGEAIKEGGRNVQMHRIASSLRTRGRSRREILERLRSENERCKPPLTDSELQTIADSAARYEPQIGDYHLTDSGNAQRLVDIFGDEIVYSNEHGKWLTWTGTKWKTDNSDSILTYAQKTAFSIADEAEKVEDAKLKKKLHAFALKSESLPSLKNSVAIARTQLSVDGSDLDRNLWILNTPNGIVDLRSGELLPHERKEFCTKLTGAEYHPESECPRWLQFLDEITDGDMRLQEYMQRIIGYSLTGDTSEHVWFLLLGNGRNGKSTFLNAVQLMLGDYSSNIRPEALLMQGMDKVPNDLAALKGARFTASSETPASRKLNESLIKQLTGGDMVQARFLFREFFEFKPQCKLFLATNYRPNIQGTDVGIWRRTHEVPFPVSIPESECDPNLSNKLEEELSGILAWAVRGCMEWQRKRLSPPEAVQSARAEYYEEMDVVGQFIKEWCKVAEMPKHSDMREAVKDLYTAYSAWCSENSEDLLTKKAFGIKLTQRNIPPCRMQDGGRGRQGIKLRAYHMPNPNGRGFRWMVE